MQVHIEVKGKQAGYIAVMKSPGVRQTLAAIAEQARDRAEQASGLRFAWGVDTDGPVSAHGWVGASSIDSRTGKVNPGLRAQQVKALSNVI